MKPFFGYYGSKWSAAPHYPAPRGRVCEPFAGAASYSVRLGLRDVVLVDLDERVCSLWDYLIHVSPTEVLSLPDVPYRGRVSEQRWPCPEARLLASCWVNTSPWRDLQGHDPNGHGLWWGPRVKRRIAEQVEHIRSWQVIRDDYTQSPDCDTLFIDPPYQVQGVHYKHGSRGLDYTALAAWCATRAIDGARVIVCEQEGADWLPWNGSVLSRRTPCHERVVIYTEPYWFADGETR